MFVEGLHIEESNARVRSAMFTTKKGDNKKNYKSLEPLTLILILANFLTHTLVFVFVCGCMCLCVCMRLHARVCVCACESYPLQILA